MVKCTKRNLAFCAPCIATYLRYKDQQDALFFVDLFNNHPVHVSKRLTMHRQEAVYCTYSIWYLPCIYED